MPGPTGINMPNTNGLFPQAQQNPGGSWFSNTAGNIPMDNTNVWSSILSLLPGPAGFAGSALGAYQPLSDTAQGAQSQTQSLSGLFGGGMGGLGGDFINWLAGQIGGNTSGLGTTGQAGKGPAPDFMSSNFGGLGRTLSGLFGGMTPPSGPAAGYGTGSLAGLPSAGPNQGFGVPPLMSSQNATWNGLPQAPGQQGFGVPPTMASMNPGPVNFGALNNPGQSSLYSAGPTSAGFSLGGLGSPNVLPGSQGGM